jgi:hypothetical protein
MEGHNWFLSHFVEIPRRSIMVCFLSLSAKAGLNLPPFEIRARICKRLRSPGIDSICLCSLAVRYIKYGCRTAPHRLGIDFLALYKVYKYRLWVYLQS